MSNTPYLYFLHLNRIAKLFLSSLFLSSCLIVSFLLTISFPLASCTVDNTMFTPVAPLFLPYLVHPLSVWNWNCFSLILFLFICPRTFVWRRWEAFIIWRSVSWHELLMSILTSLNFGFLGCSIFFPLNFVLQSVFFPESSSFVKRPLNFPLVRPVQRTHPLFFNHVLLLFYFRFLLSWSYSLPLR